MGDTGLPASRRDDDDIERTGSLDQASFQRFPKVALGPRFKLDDGTFASSPSIVLKPDE
jgi:hypothetical protein